MIAELLLTAVVMCSTGEATCTSYDLDQYTLVHVCGIAPELGDSQKKVRGFINGHPYVVTIDARCTHS